VLLLRCASAFLNTNCQFCFFRSDGITPVAVSEISEPSSFGLLIGGVGLLATLQTNGLALNKSKQLLAAAQRS